MKKFLLLAFLVCPLALLAQTGSEIFLLDLKIKKDKATISNPRNITNHPGYDNQPYFHPSGEYIYFSSFDDEGRADLKRYDLKSSGVANITKTKDREYSPTVTPERQFLSCIIQRDNGAQDLGKYPIEGGDPIMIIDNMTVGYHVWADNSHLALFVLGKDNNPHTLHYVRLPTKEDTIIASNIGRSLHKVPHERAISFIQKQDNTSTIMKLSTESMTVSPIAETIANGDNITWTPDGHILTTDGTKIFMLNPKSKAKAWIEVTVEGSIEGLKGITRLAVSPQGNQLAIVVAE